MKTKITFIFFLIFTLYSFAQTDSCGSIINETFEESVNLPTEWIEYNTSNRVTIDNGRLKLDHTLDKPSAYRTFTPVTTDFSFAFDVESTRNYVNCYMSLLSSTGKYLGSLGFGLQGDKNIKYASSLANGIPSGYSGGLLSAAYASNTTYSISLKANFTEQTLDFYNNGVLMTSDIPFLETTDDVAKIDIQLTYMYANEGRFFFDNISLISADENRLNLMSIANVSEVLLSNAKVGENYGEYPQSAVDKFQVAVDKANVILTNCDATSIEIDNALAALQAAKVVFDNAKKDDPVLKMYSEYDFSGEEKEMYCGYYNGDLAAHDNWVVSFTLEKGYMATFAEDVNGTGVSKVYIASEENLEINLPENLQKKVSFIRVSPWKNVLKKGLGAKGDDVVAALNNAWYYNWGTTGEAIENAAFVPNQWGGGSVAKAISLGERMDLTHYMAFNEPDNNDQSNMTVDKAIEKYQDLLASGLRLGSPANTDGAKGAAWRDEFLTKAEAAGLRVDYIVVHYYKKSTPAGFYNWLKAIYDKWKRPIWIKEFNYGAPWVNNKPTKNQAASDGLESYINMLDDNDFIERYAVFTWQPDDAVYSLMSIRNPVTLSISGEMYRDHISPIAYTQEVYEQGANLGVGSEEISSKILVYPTIVSNGILNLKVPEAINKNNLELTFYNAMGQQVKKVAEIKPTINVESLPSGLYVVQIKSDVEMSSKRIIIQ